LFLQRGLKKELKKGRGVFKFQARKLKRLPGANKEFFLKARFDRRCKNV
jgi:hypothetical protein